MMLETFGLLVISITLAAIVIEVLYHILSSSVTPYNVHPVAQWIHDRMKQDFVNHHNINAAVLLFLGMGLVSFVYLIYHIVGSVFL